MNRIPLTDDYTLEKAIVTPSKQIEYRTSYAYNKLTKEEEKTTYCTNQ